MPAPDRLITHLKELGYHPRSSKHGQVLCEIVLDDLLAACPHIARHAAEGAIVYDIQRKIIVGGSEWNIDLVLGPPVPRPDRVISARGIAKEHPATIRIAIEAKTIMTKHSGARRNRQRDYDSFHQFVHRYDPAVVAGALTVVNLAERFRSPLPPNEIVTHRNVRTLVEKTLSLFRELPTRSAPGDSPGLEANGALVIEHDNAIATDSAGHRPALPGSESLSPIL